MTKKLSCIFCMLFSLISLSGCVSIGSKNASIPSVYGVIAAISLILLFCYCIFIKKKEIWFLLLFASVFVVNTGYFSLSVSSTLGEALLANRISYLGSVFLPLSMLMTILNISKLKYQKWLPYVLMAITIGVFLIAASPGYLDIYYKSVSLEKINGTSVIIKEYGEWHCVYLYYLLSYFALMIAATLHAITKKRIKSGVQSAIIIIAVFVNICVWLIEQLVDVNFEFLSISYIISELFLISVYLMIQEYEKQLSSAPVQSATVPQKESAKQDESLSELYIEKCKHLERNVSTLTATEKIIYEYYLDRKPTREVMKALNITENTLKFHNKNIYSKLGVSSRKQLLEYVSALETINKHEE